MKRRTFIRKSIVTAASYALAATGWGATDRAAKLDEVTRADWLKRWKEHITGEAHERYCDHETGEEIGWLISPFLNGFYYGYLATEKMEWVERFSDWTESWLKRGVKGPDGQTGWPKKVPGTVNTDLFMDSLLGEAMAFRPVVLMADEIRRDQALSANFGEHVKAWLEAAEKCFEKWNSFDTWREVPDGGGVWVVPDFGIDQATGQWTKEYANRAKTGFTNPDNKQNHIARWMLAMHDVTGKAVYRERAEKWFRVMKSRMKTQQDGKYFVWNYWDPAGPWDLNAKTGATRHWVGVHPNGGYYEIDVEGIVAAYEHGLVFTREDMDRLIATNRDFMWNQQLKGAKFQRIDGGEPDPRWKDTPGKLWTALVPHDAKLREIFLANFDPASWEGLWATPWFVARGK